MIAKKIAVIITIIVWPISMLIAIDGSDFSIHLLTSMSVFITYYLYKRSYYLYHLPLLIIPFIDPKLALFPLIFLIIDLIIMGKSKTKFVVLLLFFAIIAIEWKSFSGQTIFIPDYEAKQEVVRNTQLYPSIFLARLFHNKARIVIDKFNNNFFALTDLNNYFFTFYPRRLTGNLNLIKYPFPAVLFLLLAIYGISKHKYNKFLVVITLSALLSLSVLSIFDLNDFILWIPINLAIIYGIKITNKFKYSSYIFIVYVILSLIELARIFAIKS